MSIEPGSPHEGPLRDGPPEEGPEIGRALEQARKGRNLSLEQAEAVTKIRARFLEDLERENFDVLPPVYARGFLKTYANFLHLDGEALSRELKRRQEPQPEPEDPAHEDPSQAAPERPRLLPGALAGIFAGAGRGETTEGRDADEERAGPIAFLSGASAASYLLGSGALLVLVAGAAALALTLPENPQTPVAQVREPLASKADLTEEVAPLRDQPFRTAGDPVPENDDPRPEKRDEEKQQREREEKKKEKEVNEEPKPVEQEKPAADVAQVPSTEPASEESPADAGSSSATVEPYVAPDPQQEVAQSSPAPTPSTSAASTPSSVSASAPSSVSASAPSSAPASYPSSTSPAPSSTPASSPSSVPAQPLPAVADGGGLGDVQAGVGAPAALPDGSEMADEIIAGVNAEVPLSARGGGLPIEEQDLPGEAPDGALPAHDLLP